MLLLRENQRPKVNTSRRPGWLERHEEAWDTGQQQLLGYPGPTRSKYFRIPPGDIEKPPQVKLCQSQPRQANRSSPSGPSRDGQSRRGAAEPQAAEKMLARSVHPLLWLLGRVVFRGTTASSTHAVTGPSQPRTHSPEVKNHTSEPSIKPTPPTNLSLTSVAQTATAKSSSVATTLPASTVPGTSKAVTPTPTPSDLAVSTPADDKSPLTVAAFGVISFIVILIVVVIILVSVVSLRFRCNRSKDSEDKQKPGTSMVSESCSAGTSQKDNSITLISMKNINTNNSMSYPPSEK
ncbi:PREDICTED: endothelial cell-specific chemotaxis regulator, partial [Chlamydotis macqueenii]|uniref:endothelial cell-specific chemotaxis regulator n=1 Tax=Chlamydotis macqueenii TaxID=187382 RepID=UPI00052A100A